MPASVVCLVTAAYTHEHTHCAPTVIAPAVASMLSSSTSSITTPHQSLPRPLRRPKACLSMHPPLCRILYDVSTFSLTTATQLPPCLAVHGCWNCARAVDEQHLRLLLLLLLLLSLCLYVVCARAVCFCFS